MSLGKKVVTSEQEFKFIGPFGGNTQNHLRETSDICQQFQLPATVIYIF